MMTLISLIAKAVCGHVVDKMAAETVQKRPLRDQAAHEHENVLSDDLYSVKGVREERKLKGSKYRLLHHNRCAQHACPVQRSIEDLCP